MTYNRSLARIVLIGSVLFGEALSIGAAGATEGDGFKGRLKVSGREFSYPDGARFPWRGITAFRLVEMVANGREADADAYLAWAARQKLTVVRVLAMAKVVFDLPPDRGVEALPRLLDMAQAHGLYVEVVALADTARYEFDIAAHVQKIGAICARHANSLIEIANEPGHGTQRDRLSDATYLERLRRLVPSTVPVALGASLKEGGLTGGDYITVHVARGRWESGRGQLWDIPEAAELEQRTGKPVISDEPVGAGEVFDRGSREDDPDRIRNMSLLTRMAGLGSTFHYHHGAQALIPDGRQAECFRAWLDAFEILPPHIEANMVFESSHDPAEPVETQHGRGALPLFVAKGKRGAWVLMIGATPRAKVTWRKGWQVQARHDWPNTILFRVVRRDPVAGAP